MSLFWGLVAGLILLGIVLVAPALLRGPRVNLKPFDRREQNITIARDRLRELDAEHARGEVGEGEWQQAREELEMQLAADLTDTPTDGLRTGSGKLALLGLLVFVPVLTLGVYEFVGSPQHVQIAGPGAGGDNPHAAADSGETPSLEELVQRLADRLAADPANPDGWFMLGRSYMSLGRYADAVQALERLREQIGDHPTALVMLANATAMNQGGRVAGRPEELVLIALAQEPDNVTALWLAGNAAEEQGDFTRALAFWKRAETGLSEQPEMLAELRGRMAAAERRGGGIAPMAEEAVATDAAGPSLNVKVMLAPELAAKAQPDALVFVFARAVSGPPMPLAAARAKVSDLPLQVTLDDSMAMLPQMKLSGFSEVSVGARIALSGQPVAQSGDLQSDAMVVNVAQGVDVDLVIDREVP